MREFATRLVYAAIARYEGRPFTPVMAVLMEDAANKAMREFLPSVQVTIGGRLDAAGMLQIAFKNRPPAPDAA